MKKTLFALSLFLLVGCTCIGQIPDQIVYVDETCTVPLPDYIPMVEVSDNCSVISVTQTPAPGYVLSAANPIVEVEITATDDFNNQSSIFFNVVALDTIPPTITPNEELMTFSVEKGGDIFRAGHYYMAHSIQQSVERRPDSALVQWPVLAEWDTIWDDSNMVTFFPAGGEGTYLGTFYSPGSYLCSCDSTTYYAQIEGGAVINLQFSE